MRRRSLLLAGAATGIGAVGCGPHAFVPVAPSKPSDSSLESDPVELLPGRPLAFARFDLASLFATPLGSDIAGMLASVFAVGAEANFSPQRDLSKMYAGVYAMQGVDICGVVTGRFDVAAISRAGDGKVASGQLVKTRYGAHDTYTFKNYGFSVLTGGLMMFGNEVGLRRGLDRIRYGKVRNEIPPWMLQAADTPRASFAIVGDFGAEVGFSPDVRIGGARPRESIATPILQRSGGVASFLVDLKALRVLGNFEAPGVNLVGALTYPGPEYAARGASGMRDTAQLASLATMFTGGSVPPMQVNVNGNDVGFAQSVDSQIARSLVRLVQ